ncbi:hypothetical protein CkaCkLH20_05292 [Colletotrichum karsti]|uniref:Magnesium transporter n=1 Tax=Colletotrichum karsti TaxID=1095194 RepID=A0A9P6IAK6_9PEZI|nr:uncharacterized protein CkaCkLH20_05292 [Colletotrichum karsti]KAF9877026.1 hypothetical protein CkaCkLH20_05292 [Colletotrichum karsti]
MAQNPIDEVVAPFDGMDLDQDDSTSMRGDSASTLLPIGRQTRRERRRAEGRKRVERIFGDRMKGKRGDAFVSTEEDPEKKLFRAIEHFPETLRTGFKTGVSFHTVKPIEHSIAENLCRNLSLRGTLGGDSARLFAFARTLVSQSNNIKSYYPTAKYEGSFDERRKFFFQVLADRLVVAKLGGGVPPRRWDRNLISRQTCEAMLNAFAEARVAYLRMDMDDGEKVVQEGTYTKKVTKFIKELDQWISFIQKLENKEQQGEDHELADAMGDLGMGNCNEPKRLRCTEVDEHGGVTVRFISPKKTELTTRYGLVPRDIRKIEASALSHIGLRPSTVLVHLFHLKVLVQRDRALIFDDATSMTSRDNFLRDIREAIRLRDTTESEAAAYQEEDKTYSQPRASFEFLALEAVLSSVVSELEVELEAVRRPAEHVLKSLEYDVDRRVLLNLFGLSGKATWVAAQAELVLTAVEDVLDWDDSLAALYLTAKAGPDGRAKTADDDLTAAEMLLGSYYNALNEIVQEAQSLVSSIRNTQESASAILDANRNTLMLLDLKFRMGTVGLATGSFFSAFYGMNISNYILEYNWAFAGVCGTSALLTVVAICYGSSGSPVSRLWQMEQNIEMKRLGKM